MSQDDIALTVAGSILVIVLAIYAWLWVQARKL
jgi:hypothetical protein